MITKGGNLRNSGGGSRNASERTDATTIAQSRLNERKVSIPPQRKGTATKRRTVAAKGEGCRSPFTGKDNGGISLSSAKGAACQRARGRLSFPGNGKVTGRKRELWKTARKRLPQKKEGEESLTRRNLTPNRTTRFRVSSGNDLQAYEEKKRGGSTTWIFLGKGERKEEGDLGLVRRIGKGKGVQRGEKKKTAGLRTAGKGEKSRCSEWN